MSEFDSTGRERRLSPRFAAVLECAVSLPEGERSSGLLFPHTSLDCRTRDLSETGLGLAVPSIYIGYDCIIDQGRTLLVSLALPTGPVEIKATAVHYVRRDRAGEEATYLIGLSIVAMGDKERSRYAEFLSGLAGTGQT